MEVYYLRRKPAEQYTGIAMADRIYIGDNGAFHFDSVSAEESLSLLQTYR